MMKIDEIRKQIETVKSTGKWNKIKFLVQNLFFFLFFSAAKQKVVSTASC